MTQTLMYCFFSLQVNILIFLLVLIEIDSLLYSVMALQRKLWLYVGS